jgi:hypothetical protein
MRHIASVTGVKVAIEIEDASDYCTVQNCFFDLDSDARTTDEFLVTIRTNDASNYAYIADNWIDNGLSGATAAISFTKDTKGTQVLRNHIMGDYSTACINGITTLSRELRIEDNLLINGYADGIGTEPTIELLTGSTGFVRNNVSFCNVATLAAHFVGDAMVFSNNHLSEDVGPGATTATTAASIVASADD